MNNIQRFIKTSSIYFLGNVLTKIVSFLLLPLYTNRISPEDFGYYDLSNSILSLIVPLVFFQIWDGVFRYSFDYEEKEIVVNNGFVVMLFGMGVFSVLNLVFNNFINIEFGFLIYLTGIFTGLHYFYGYVARAHMNNKLFVISGFLNTLFNIVLNIILITQFNLGIEALYISVIIGTLVQIIIIELKLKPILKFKFSLIDRKLIKELVSFSIPISISTISYWLLGGFTRVIISKELGNLENGIYAVANKFCSVVVLVSSVFQFAWNEIAYLSAKNENKEKEQEFAINLIMKLIITITPIMLLMIKFISPYFIADSYREAEGILPIVFLGTIVNCLASFIGTVFLANKQSKVLSNSTLISAVSNIIFTLILTSRFGIYGASIALSLSFFINLIVRIIVIKKVNKLKILSKDLILRLCFLFFSVVIYYTAVNVLQVIFCLIYIYIFIYSFKNIFSIVLNNIIKK